MTAWHDYQVQAAEFFRSVGLAARVDERISTRGTTHDVDVAVRLERVGISQLWIVECKHWKRPVSKLHIAALANIVQDVGADRGILLSESGFQAGAIAHATSRNITLTCLAELKAGAANEIDMAAFGVTAADFIMSLGARFRCKTAADVGLGMYRA